MKRILIFLNYVAAFTLLLSYLVHLINPAEFWPTSLLGLAYPFLLFVNLAFAVLWVFRKKKILWLSLLTILIGWPMTGKHFQMSLAGDESEEGKAFHVLSYNVRLFDLYNWQNEQNELGRDKIYDFLATEGADIVCLQEYFSSASSGFSTDANVAETTNNSFMHVAQTSVLNADKWGIATFSKYPIVDRGVVEFATKSNNICIFTDIDIGKDIVRVYNAHLGSIHIGYEEYQFLEKVGAKRGSRDSSGPLGTSEQVTKSLEEDVPIPEVTKSIVKLLRNAFVSRSAQARAVAKHVANSPHPVIICGDINDTPASYAYHTLAEDLQDGFVEKGLGMGNTYAGALPFFRIDYVLSSEELSVLDFHTRSDVQHSDHYPLSCKFEL